MHKKIGFSRRRSGSSVYFCGTDEPVGVVTFLEWCYWEPKRALSPPVSLSPNKVPDKVFTQLLEGRDGVWNKHAESCLRRSLECGREGSAHNWFQNSLQVHEGFE